MSKLIDIISLVILGLIYLMFINWMWNKNKIK